MKEEKMNNKQITFCQEYVKNGLNGTQAYLKAYKTCKKEDTAKVNASRLLTNANIQNYIQELQEKIEKQIPDKEKIVNKNINTYEKEDGVEVYVTYEVLENIGTNEKIVF